MRCSHSATSRLSTLVIAVKPFGNALWPAVPETGFCRDVQGIHHLTGSVARGNLTAIVGPNGSGKPTLIKAIVGLLKPMSGTCRVAPGLKLAYLPQQSELDRRFPAKVMSLVALGLWQKRGLLGRHRAEDRQSITAGLRTVGLEV